MCNERWVRSSGVDVLPLPHPNCAFMDNVNSNALIQVTASQRLEPTRAEQTTLASTYANVEKTVGEVKQKW